jgi:alpha-beta hydrolase superfamily lysophospholipase
VKAFAPIYCVLVCGVLFGCTSITEIRTEKPADNPAILPEPKTDTAAFLACRTGSKTKDENRLIVEDYANYFIGFAEFDDQGWAYKRDEQLAVIKSRIDADLADPRYADTDFLVLVFAHGWHHNAHDNDCNVQEFRQMVRLAAEGTQDAIKNKLLVRQRRVIGVYVGWRGESVDAPALRYLTVIDRRDAAERVAKGSVRQLFANLHEEQVSAQRVRMDKMRTVVIGHSFGGLVAYSAMSQGQLNDLTQASLETPRYCDPSDPRGNTRPAAAVWPDSLILINPAFEASRFEEFHRLVMERATCIPPLTQPKRVLVVPSLIVVTAENDRWTGGVFTVGRSVSTLFEGYDRTDPSATQAERTANLHAIGFVPAYVTHRLYLPPGDGSAPAIASLSPASPGKTNVDLPVWVVTASKDIVNGHTGFLYARLTGTNSNGTGKAPEPYLANWLLDLYSKDCSAAPEMMNCGQWATSP